MARDPRDFTTLDSILNGFDHSAKDHVKGGFRGVFAPKWRSMDARVPRTWSNRKAKPPTLVKAPWEQEVEE